MEYLEKFGSITAMEGFEKLRITSLSQEITRIEQAGHLIEHKRESDSSTHWTKYTLVKINQLSLV